MNDNIELQIVGAFGDRIGVKQTAANLEIKIETQIADLFSEICQVNNSIKEQETKIASKFYFAVNLQNYLEEMKQDANTI